VKGNAKIMDVLNALLADELTAINEYMVHSEMCANWGYGRLHTAVEKRAVDEMKHAEKLIGRILFLEGTPVVSVLKTIRIGSDVPTQFASDLAAEMTAIQNYNRAITVAVDVGDNATREILEGILKEEDGHVNQIEESVDQIDQMGVQNFLATQARG
jgi:bacterioferritin